MQTAPTSRSEVEKAPLHAVSVIVRPPQCALFIVLAPPSDPLLNSPSARNDVEPTIPPRSPGSMSYVHKPVTADEIRVVYLKATASGEICCRMKHVAFADAIYTALSYPWGPKKYTDISILDDVEGDDKVREVVDHRGSSTTTGKRILVTHQLHFALKDLVKASLEPKAFWIDQICIDQNNVVDREYHVKRMRYIYPKARMVVTYAGPDTEGDEAAIDLFQQLSSKYVIPWEAGPAFRHDNLWQWLMNLETRQSDLGSNAAASATSSTRNTYGLSKELRDCMQSPLPVHKGWPALIAILLGPWGQRRWMTQENVLNSNTRLLRGSHILNQRHAVHLLSLLRFHLHFRSLPILPADQISAPISDFYLDDDQILKLNSASNLSRASRTGPNQSATRNLHELLQWFRDTHCADPRDQIYALLSLAQDDDDLKIEVDYTSVEEVGAGEVPQRLLKRVSMAIIKRHGFMLYNRSREGESASRPSGMPSWVPLWEMNSLATGLIHPGRKRIDTTKEFPVDSCIHFDEGDTVLVAKGSFIGSVSKIFGMSSRRLFDNLQMSKQDSSSPQHTIGRTFRAAKSYLEHHDVGDLDYVLGSAYLARSTWTDHNQHHLSTDQSTQRCDICADQIRVAYKAAMKVLDFENDEPVDANADLGVDFIKDIGVYSAQLAAVNDKVSCWIPLDAQESDLVVRFVGDVAGFVLRPAGTGSEAKYRMIGPAYVQGYMYGEDIELGQDWHKTARRLRII